MLTCYAQMGATRRNKVLSAFAHGAGAEVVTGAEHVRPGPAIFFGAMNETVPLFKEAVEDKYNNWYYIDNAYFRHREYYRITKNAEFHSGEGVSDCARLDQLGVRIREWQDNRDGHVLITLQTSQYYEARGVKRGVWLECLVTSLKKFTRREIRVREKPRKKRGTEVPGLYEDLEGAWALVCHSSRTAIEAVCFGVPAFVTDPCAAVRCAGTDVSMIEEPYRPDDRREWAGVLADNQWTPQEMLDGVAWRALMRA